MDPYAIFLDIDETLAHNGCIPKENRDAIQTARKAGHKVFLNTGRSKAHIPDFVWDIEYDGFVCGIGAHIVCNGNTLKKKSIDMQACYRVAAHFFKQDVEVIFEGEETSIGNNICLSNPRYVFTRDAEDFLGKYKDIVITKIFIGAVLTPEEQQTLSQKYCFFQHEGYAEFGPAGCSKSDGMLTVIKELDIPLSHCIAMGDSINDLDMLKTAGISVAMGNASDKIKRNCTFVSDRAENAGVAKAIEKLLFADN